MKIFVLYQNKAQRIIDQVTHAEVINAFDTKQYLRFFAINRDGYLYMGNILLDPEDVESVIIKEFNA